MLAKFRDISLGICALTVALALAILFPNLYRLVRDSRAIVADSRPELKAILQQTKLGAFEMRTAAKAFTEDLNSREAMQARLATQRAGASAAALFERMNAEWIPRGAQVLDSSNAMIGDSRALIVGADRRLNADDGLVAELSRTVAALRVPVETVTPKLVELIENGSLALADVRAVLAGPEMKQAIAELSRASTGLADTTREAARATKNLADTAERFPLLADQLNKFASTANKFQKALIFARIVSLLGGVFF